MVFSRAPKKQNSNKSYFNEPLRCQRDNKESFVGLLNFALYI